MSDSSKQTLGGGKFNSLPYMKMALQRIAIGSGPQSNSWIFENKYSLLVSTSDREAISNEATHLGAWQELVSPREEPRRR